MALECLPTALLCEGPSEPIALAVPVRRVWRSATPVGDAVSILTPDIDDRDLAVVVSATVHDEAAAKGLALAAELA